MQRIVSVSYKGECPRCGERQWGASDKVDILCGICEAKDEMEKIHDTKFKALEGGTVHSITGYDTKGIPSMMSITTKDFIYDIKFKMMRIESIWKR